MQKYFLISLLLSLFSNIISNNKIVYHVFISVWFNRKRWSHPVLLHQKLWPHRYVDLNGNEKDVNLTKSIAAIAWVSNKKVIYNYLNNFQKTMKYINLLSTLLWQKIWHKIIIDESFLATTSFIQTFALDGGTSKWNPKINWT